MTKLAFKSRLTFPCSSTIAARSRLRTPVPCSSCYWRRCVRSPRLAAACRPGWSLRPQSVPLAAVTSPGMDELRRFGPPRRDLLAGETVTSQGRSHESTSQTLEIPPAPPSPSCLPSGSRVPPGGTLKILSHLGKLSQGSLDSTPGLSESSWFQQSL